MALWANRLARAPAPKHDQSFKYAKVTSAQIVCVCVCGQWQVKINGSFTQRLPFSFQAANQSIGQGDDPQ